MRSVASELTRRSQARCSEGVVNCRGDCRSLMYPLHTPIPHEQPIFSIASFLSCTFSFCLCFRKIPWGTEPQQGAFDAASSPAAADLWACARRRGIAVLEFKFKSITLIHHPFSSLTKSLLHRRPKTNHPAQPSHNHSHRAVAVAVPVPPSHRIASPLSPINTPDTPARHTTPAPIPLRGPSACHCAEPSRHPGPRGPFVLLSHAQPRAATQRRKAALVRRVYAEAWDGGGQG
jgi:hypothetical protein